MWPRDTYWFDLSIYFGCLVLGSICFGRFEDWKPRWRRVLKIVIASALFVTLLQVGGRPVAWGVMSVVLVAALYVHAVWLPRHGINGWTGEPREKYLELMAGRRG